MSNQIEPSLLQHQAPCEYFIPGCSINVDPFNFVFHALNQHNQNTHQIIKLKPIWQPKLCP